MPPTSSISGLEPRTTRTLLSTMRTSICLLFLTSLTSALEVSPDSPCSPKCIDDPRTGNASSRDDSLTFNRDLFCFDWEISGANSTQSGLKFRDCNNCLKSSGYTETTWNERDVGWFLFNNRGVIDWCLSGRFGEETNKDISASPIYTACNNRCTKLYTAADYMVKSAPSSYNFCDIAGNFTQDAESCLDCLYETPGLTTLGNVLATVVDMCKQKPGKTYNSPSNQDIYAPTKLMLSSPEASQSNSLTSTPTSVPTSSSSSTSSPQASSSGGLSKGALAGIIVGALLGAALLLASALLLLRRKKNQRKGAVVETSYTPVRGQQKVLHEMDVDHVAQYDPAELPAHGKVEMPTESGNNGDRRF
ncbi:hypothetical protein HBI56_070120 [Parastagonospora nodorum]|nr:hypothetical protein HBI10_087150 [Parastagonospora nodorum]KAH4027235.1 hypothetical protein HBI13_056160 [Parastagonospora nodorum]KAH4179391.1 hypothetical protein HBH43_016730 [Parastagonospora nodorum]KAH4223419.1 hypothetical protein HBI06_135060 [Parastagonospora nodorum]KAH4231086.1 hypothetical protein HBI05_185070 [Parastagonospora nodorum]